MIGETKKLVDALRCKGRSECNDGCKYQFENVICDMLTLENDAADLIEKQNAEIEELRTRVADLSHAIKFNGKAADEDARKLRDEIEGLKNRVYNLTLYMREIIKDYGDEIGSDYDTILDYYMDAYDGMPGYNPEILEAQHE